MYVDEVPIISAAMRRDLTTFKRGVMFAVCSIRQPTVTVPKQLGVLFEDIPGEWPLWGFKRRTWEYLKTEAIVDVWNTLRHTADPTEAITATLQIPGVGIVKGGFIAQLIGHNVACLDSRNVTRENRNPSEFKTRGDTRKQTMHTARLVARYVAEVYGRAEYYWNVWCTDVARVYKQTPQAISKLHLAIVPEYYVPF